MSLSSWLVAGIVPSVERQPLKKLAIDESALLKLLYRWREEAGKQDARSKEGMPRFDSKPGCEVSREKATQHCRVFFSTHRPPADSLGNPVLALRPAEAPYLDDVGICHEPC
jgi:hypothetical protein